MKSIVIAPSERKRPAEADRFASLMVSEHRCHIADALCELRQTRKAYLLDRMFSSLTFATPRYGPAG